MPVYEFSVELTVGDNTAFTVFTALRGLGYDALERVERSEILRLRMPDGAMSIDACGAALTRAEVIFNPNKHRLSYAHAARDSDEHEAVVADKDDDNTGLADLLRDRFGITPLNGVERATAWRLFEKNAQAPVQRLEWACAELLANPFSQTYIVRTRPASIAVKP